MSIATFFCSHWCLAAVKSHVHVHVHVHYVSLLRADTKNNSSDIQPSMWAASCFSGIQYTYIYFYNFPLCAVVCIEHNSANAVYSKSLVPVDWLNAFPLDFWEACQLKIAQYLPTPQVLSLFSSVFLSACVRAHVCILQQLTPSLI